MSENQPFLKEIFLPLSILLTGILITAAIIFSSLNSADRNALNNEQVKAENGLVNELESGEQNPVFVPISTEGWPSIGNEEAPVTIVLYSDYACPFCERFATNTLPLIKENYIDQGIVRFVYKDFAVVGGNRAAEAAHCAGEQGKYWEYHDILFANLMQDRARWSDSSVHERYARELGLDYVALVECFESRRHQTRVEESTREAISKGATGTPFFVLNDRISIEGAQPFEVFSQAISFILENEENF